MPDWLGSAITGFGSLGASAVSGIFNANQAKKNRAFQERMYEKQKNDSIEFWKMQNEYHLPSAELQRIKDSGLNPLLLYGAGGVSGQSSSQPAMPSAPHGAQASASFENPLAGSVAAYAQMRLLNAQKENVEADTMKKIQEALERGSQNVKNWQESQNLKTENDFNLSTMELRKEAIVHENNLKVSLEQTEQSKRNEIEEHINKLIAETSFIGAQEEMQGRLTDAQIREIDTRIDNSIKETTASIKLMAAQERNQLAEAYYNRAMAAIVNDPEYQKAYKNKEIQAVANMIKQGKVLELEEALRKYKRDMLPLGDKWNHKLARGWSQFINWTLGPLGDILSGVLGGAGAAMISK